MKEKEQQILDRTAIVGVVGLGYVGLPIAVSLCDAGYRVQGIDIQTKHIEQLKQGTSYIIDVADEKIKTYIERKLFVSDSYDTLDQCDAIIICVPTPLTESKEPDLSYINIAMDGILQHIKQGVLITLESTTYPGTTKELIVERVQKEKGWTVGEDYFVCFSPERIDPCSKSFTVTNTPKVVGGTTEECLRLGYLLYDSFIDTVVPVKSTEVAELSKLLENTFRCINIAFMNEMMIMAERLEIDIWEALDAAATKPFGFMKFTPGPGVGGHCIPLDPMYLSWAAKKSNFYSRFIELAMDVNDNMPYYVISQIQSIFATIEHKLETGKLLLVGMAYKKDIDDLRESPALDVYRLLEEMGANVSFYDPYVEAFKYKGTTIERKELTEQMIKDQDLVIILTNHTNVPYEWILKHASLVYDTRNVYKGQQAKNLIHIGDKIL